MSLTGAPPFSIEVTIVFVGALLSASKSARVNDFVSFNPASAEFVKL